MKRYSFTTAFLFALIPVYPLLCFAQTGSTVETTAPVDRNVQRAQYEAMLEMTEKARLDAMKIADEAREIAKIQAENVRRNIENMTEVRSRNQELQERETEKMREELSRTHRELREASREIARAHRELSMLEEQKSMIRRINLGDRAVIGIILGPETPEGVKIIGVSPDGPAEKAGLRQGDILQSIEGTDLAGPNADPGRKSIARVMENVQDGDELDLSVIRDGAIQSFVVTAEIREPRAWQSLIRIPDVEAITDGVSNHEIIIKQIEMPEIDEEALNAEIAGLKEKVKDMEHIFITSEDGIDGISGDWEWDIGDMSQLGEHALREANVWFGLPHALGFELTSINPGLGAYFEVDRGVLVIKAEDDNAYRLQSGDVVLEIGTTAVDSPADMMRALRELDAGSEIDITIKRERRDVSLRVIVPENRFGLNSITPR